MDQYLALCQTILNEGVWIHNDRTNKKVLTYINADLTYNVAAGHFPLVTTRKCFWKSAIAEILGYLRGYDNAADFRKIGTKTWDANANDNIDANPDMSSNPNNNPNTQPCITGGYCGYGYECQANA